MKAINKNNKVDKYRCHHICALKSDLEELRGSNVVPVISIKFYLFEIVIYND